MTTTATTTTVVSQYNRKDFSEQKTEARGEMSAEAPLFFTRSRRETERGRHKTAREVTNPGDADNHEWCTRAGQLGPTRLRSHPTATQHRNNR